MANAGTHSDTDVAIRCRVLTLIYAGNTSSTFAELIGVSATRWNNVEHSGALSRDMAFKIVRRFPEISLDWLWRGRDDGLPRAKGDELSVAFRALASVRAPGPAKRKRQAS